MPVVVSNKEARVYPVKVREGVSPGDTLFDYCNATYWIESRDVLATEQVLGGDTVVTITAAAAARLGLLSAKLPPSSQIGVYGIPGDEWNVSAPGSFLTQKTDGSQYQIEAICKEIQELLLRKNAAYKNSALQPLRIFSLAADLEGIAVRCDDKASRIRNAGGLTTCREDDVIDLLGYLVLTLIARRNQKTAHTDCGMT